MGLYAFGKVICWTYFKVVHRLSVKGCENIPQNGPVILCSNHISNLDPPLVGVACPRRVCFMAKAELFNHKLLRKLITSLGAFPVQRGKGDRQALRLGLQVLEKGQVLGLFPEGTRSKSKHVGKGLTGAGFFALRSGAPVIPCAIIGSYRPFGKMTVVFGRPISLSRMNRERLTAREATDEIMEAIAKLLHESA